MATIKAGIYRFNNILTRFDHEYTAEFEFEVYVKAPLYGVDGIVTCDKIIFETTEQTYGIDNQFIYNGVALNGESLGGLPVAVYQTTYYLGEWDGIWDADLFGNSIQTITVTKDQEVDDTFALFFITNAVPVIEIDTANGRTLYTKGKICKTDFAVVPKLQEKSVSAFAGEATADEGYCGLSKVTIDLPMLETATVTPSNEVQVIKPTSGAFLSQVTVATIPPMYEIPVYFDAETDIVLGESASLISFTIGGTSYQAVEGMTWAEWVADTKYNTDGYELIPYGITAYIKNSVTNKYVYYSSDVTSPVLKELEITENGVYLLGGIPSTSN